MARYLQLVVLTDKGRKNFNENPDWIKEELDKEIELLGGKIVTQYALLGQYDFINIIEALRMKSRQKSPSSFLLPAQLIRPRWPPFLWKTWCRR
jgi:uncharacterized protein with GYD domain